MGIKHNLPISERLAINMRAAESGDCIEWAGALKTNGYGVIRINRKLKLAHRVAMELALGKTLRRDVMVCHRCDNPRCINVEHLFLGKAQANMADARKKGRLLNHTHGRLTADQRASIAEHYGAGGSPAALAREHGISCAAVIHIAKARNTHLLRRKVTRRVTRRRRRPVNIEPICG